MSNVNPNRVLNIYSKFSVSLRTQPHLMHMKLHTDFGCFPLAVCTITWQMHFLRRSFRYIHNYCAGTAAQGVCVYVCVRAVYTLYIK